MKVFITKYALTDGIKEINGATHEIGISERMVSYVIDGAFASQAMCVHKPDWHLTKAEAVERAEAMRVAKIASLRKSIAKLEKLTFAVSA
jgi:hypothetical protein